MLHKQIWMVLFGLLLSATGAAAVDQCTRPATVDDSARGGFLAAAYAKHVEVTVEVLSIAGCARPVLESLRTLGATVRFADERVGYAQIVLPQGKVLDVLDLPGIAAAVVNTGNPLADPDSTAVIPLAQRKPAAVPPIALPFPRVAKELTAGGPYFAAEEAGLTAFWQQHPQGDGRGVRVAVMDGGIDLLQPALQLAKDRDGEPVPKVADIVIRFAADKDANWVQFAESVQAVNGSFSASGRSWTAPHNGRFRFGLFTRTIYLNSGNTSSKEYSYTQVSVPLSVGALWDEQSDRVWVDTDGDGSFVNQTALGDYATTHAVDYFGRKEGEDDNRIPFGIKIDRAHQAAYLSIADDGHGTYVAGPLAANRQTGGLFDGAAPNAQLIDVPLSDVLDLMPMTLVSLARADVDVLNRSGWLGLPPADDDTLFHMNDMTGFDSQVLTRAIEVYDKPVACFCGSPNALYVLDYQSGEMLRRNRQLPPPYGEAMSGGVWFTPDGLVDTILAPSTSLGTDSRYMPFAVRGEDGRLHATDTILAPPAPDGYTIGANPSPTIPVVSGILADLISEARRTRVRYNAARLTQALFTGTRLVQGFPLSDQGFGLVNAAGAWDQLKKMARADDTRNPVLTSFTVARVLKGQRQEVNGFQADLPRAGGTLQEELWITRGGGYAGGRAYRLALRGDDGTYTLPDRKATLSQNQPARVRFSAQVRSGFHVAFLQLIDAKAGVVMQEVPLSLKAPDVPQILAPGVEQYRQTVPPLHVSTLYVRVGDVGEDVQAARFAMRIPYDGPSFISVRSMPGFMYGVSGIKFVATAPPPGEPLDAAHHVGPMEEFESLVANAQAGTREVTWENRGRPEYATPYDPPAPDVPIMGTVVVRKYALGFTLLPEHAVQVANKLASVEGKVEFYSAALTSTELNGAAAHALASLNRKLGAHLEQWRVQVSSGAQANAALDAFLLNCTGKGGCELAAQHAVSAQGTTLVVDNPPEGDWKIVVRARNPFTQTVSYRVQEAALAPLTNTTESGSQRFGSGASMRVSLPTNVGDALYVAFRIAGTPGKKDQKEGLRVAMTALTPAAP